MTDRKITDPRMARGSTRGAEEQARYLETVFSAMRANPTGDFSGVAQTCARWERGTLAVKATGLPSPQKAKIRTRAAVDPRVAAWIRTTTPVESSRTDSDRDLARLILTWDESSGKARKRADDTLRAACYGRAIDPSRLKEAWRTDDTFHEGMLALVY